MIKDYIIHYFLKRILLKRILFSKGYSFLDAYMFLCLVSLSVLRASESEDRLLKTESHLFSFRQDSILKDTKIKYHSPLCDTFRQLSHENGRMSCCIRQHDSPVRSTNERIPSLQRLGIFSRHPEVSCKHKDVLRTKIYNKKHYKSFIKTNRRRIQVNEATYWQEHYGI